MIQQHILHNKLGLSVTILNYGGIIQAIKTKTGTNLVLGFNKTADYIQHNYQHFGAIIGRLANRVANAKFKINNHVYNLERNEKNKQCLHSGSTGLQFVYWDLKFLHEDNAVQLKYHSPDGEGGFPGNVDFLVTYQLTETNQLIMTYRATTDQVTPIDLTNHTYWNLSANETILHARAKFYADQYLPTDIDNIPLGNSLSIKNTPLDFIDTKSIGQDIMQLPETHGYDHYYILNHTNTKMQLATEIIDSHYHLKVFTDQPGFQFYSGNFLRIPYAGFCIETQNYPNAINQVNFPSPLITPEKAYSQQTIFQLELM